MDTITKSPSKDLLILKILMVGGPLFIRTWLVFGNIKKYYKEELVIRAVSLNLSYFKLFLNI